MKTTKLIQLARAKKQESVLNFLRLAFNGFAYPVYLFGSYATGQFHGYSDVDIVIIAPDDLSTKVYQLACNKMAELGLNYDILIASSISRLDSSMLISLLAINVPVQPSRISASSSRHQTGMTLIEIMIALLIGAFLLGGVLQIFSGSQQTYRMQENLSRLQENGRFALDFLADDLRMAGFIGCNSQAVLTNTLNTPTSFLYHFNNPVDGFEATSATAWTPAINAAITSPLGGSDVVTLRRADDTQSFTVIAQASGTDGLTLDATATTTNLKSAGFLNSAGANNCAIAVVADCSAVAVFQVSAIAGSVLSHTTGGSCSPGNSTNDLGNIYKNGQVYPINTISYYVRTGTGGSPSLYRKIGSNDAQELVEGIEQIQVLYGEDTNADGTPNYYVKANNVADMSKVVSIRISLLAATLDDNLTVQPMPYTYNGVTITTISTPAVTDRKIRRVFTATIALRNRLL